MFTVHAGEMFAYLYLPITNNLYCVKLIMKQLSLLMFLGGSRNTRDCIIMNEESITFNYHSNKNTLKAIARRPLIILTKVHKTTPTLETSYSTWI